MNKTCELLKDKKCIPCEGGTPPLTPEQVRPLQTELSDWLVIDNKKIQKNYTFKDFKHALSFINQVGKIAESEGHHPDINLHDWNKITLTLSTHAIKGLSENDFILAAKINMIHSK